MSKTGRPKLGSAKRRSISISLTDDELRAATDPNNWQHTIAEQLAECIRAGAAARAREDRIGAEGFELGTTDTGLELVLRIRDARGARVLDELIKIYEEKMRQDATRFYRTTIRPW